MPSNPVPFVFNRNFGSEPDTAECETIPLAEHERLLAAARQAAHAKGLAEGEQRARDAHASQSAQIEARIAEALHAALPTLDAAVEAQGEAAARLAMTIGRKLSAALIAREPLAEVEALIAECLGETRAERQVVVHVSAALAPTLELRLAAIAAQAGFAGRLTVVAEGEMLPSDCRIEWAQGSVMRSLAGLDQDIRTRIARHFANRRAKPEGDKG